MSAYDLHVSIFKVKRIVASSRLFDLLTKFGLGQVRYGGDAQCGGGNCSSWDGGRFDTLQCEGRKSGIDRVCGREIPGDGSGGCFKLCRDLGRHRLPLSSHLTFSCLPGVPFLFFVFPLQPGGVSLAKFLIHKSGTVAKLQHE
jgi:hypothetical protein